MTDTTLSSDAFFVSEQRSVGIRSRNKVFGLSRIIACLPAAILITIPDSEVIAKLFKLNMILDNFNQRVLPNLFS